MSSRVIISHAGDERVARVDTDMFPPHIFPIYQRVSEEAGARWVRARGGKYVPLEKVFPLASALRYEGFDVVVEQPVLAAIGHVNTLQHTLYKQAHERVERINAEMLATSGYSMFPYQRYGAFWLSQRYGALLADEQGLGKTLQTIAALPQNAGTMIVCPASLKDNWLAEFRKWRPQLDVRVLTGRGSFRWPRAGEILIFNYELLPEIHDKEGVRGRRCEGFLPPKPCLGCKKQWVMTSDYMGRKNVGHVKKCNDRRNMMPPERCPGCHPILHDPKLAPPEGTCFVVDEAHKTKGDTSARGMRTRAIGRAVRSRSGRTWMLTGTPIENEPMDLWNVLDAAGVTEECFGDTPMQTFRRLFKARKLDHGYAWGLPDDEIAVRVQRGALRRMKVDVLPDLPAKMHSHLIVDVDTKQLRACDRVLKEFGGIENILEKIDKESFDFKNMAAARKALATAKIPKLLELIQHYQEEKEVMIVYSMHREPIEAVGELPGWEVIHGGIPVPDRQPIIKRFQAGELKGIGVTIPTAGAGLTLTRSSLGIFIDLSYKPSENEQAEDRQHRIGTHRSVRYIIITANHVLDRRINEILFRKRKLITAAVDAARTVDDERVDPSKQLERELLEVQKQIVEQSTDVERRSAVTDHERWIAQGLRSLYYQRSEERVASKLSEDLESVGLTDAQWSLAERVVQTGTVEAEKSDEGEGGEADSEDGEDVEGLDVADETCHEAHPSSEARGGAARDAVVESERADEQEGSTEERTMAKAKAKTEAEAAFDKGIDEVVEQLRKLSTEQRAAFFAFLDDETEFCLSCGMQGTEDALDEHDCPADLDEEEEDGDDKDRS